MFTTEFEAEVEVWESATLHQYYREAMIQGYNFAFEVTVTQCMFAKKLMLKMLHIYTIPSSTQTFLVHNLATIRLIGLV